MIWLYWRRSRVAIGTFGLTLGALVALVMVASTLADGRRPGAALSSNARRSSISASRSSLPSADDPVVRRGLLLMAAAVAACQSVPYRGVQIVAWSSPEGSSTYLLDVWHRPGQPELAKGDEDSGGETRSSPFPVSSGGGAVRS